MNNMNTNSCIDNKERETVECECVDTYIYIYTVVECDVLLS